MGIRYFQRYHQHEDAVTDNTMLLFERLYTYSPKRFNEFFSSLFGRVKDDFSSEINFSCQVSTINSRLDAVISQTSFKIGIETKLWDWFGKEQLENHLNLFSKNPCNDEDLKILMTLSSELMNQETKSEFEKDLENFNNDLKRNQCNIIYHINTTFEELISYMRDVLDEIRDFEFLEILNDYEIWCYEENLIKETWKFMKCVPVGNTYELNTHSKIYWNKKLFHEDYLGLYHDKKISDIGKIIGNPILAKWDNSKQDLNCKLDKLNDQDKELIKLIREIIQNNDDLKENALYYYRVDNFYQTDFAYKGKGAYSRRPFAVNLTEYLDNNIDQQTSAETIAEGLNGKTLEK